MTQWGARRALEALAGTGLELDADLKKQACHLLHRLERHHPASYAHSLRVARLTMAMWRAAPDRLGCGATALLGSALHDAGKLQVPASCLASPAPLSAEERRLVQAHATAGASLLATLGFRSPILDVAAHHHERWEGGGYPTGRPTAEFAPIVRAVAVADAFTAMTEPGRSYRKPLPREAARDELLACRGSQFDPEAVDLLLQALAQKAAPKRGRMARLLGRVQLAPPRRFLAPIGF
jgi:putative nucleotidyltransferase with HDIG domain